MKQKNNVTFKTGYYLELLTSEMMNKDKNGENVPD